LDKGAKNASTVAELQDKVDDQKRKDHMEMVPDEVTASCQTFAVTANKIGIS
jgi:hypothetical protein